ncbi:MAG: cyclic nucleotide-binding domain-containing protein [Erysipelotrichaceae bacterium]|nr:cyclic nucleotide-binding domain-containing protein [Erysipelotrichaceae bacterium]
MKKIIDPERLERYYRDNDFLSLFKSDARKFTELIVFEKNEYIIREGVPSEYIFFLTEGEVRYFSISNTGRIIPFGGTNTFRVFGEVASLWNLAPSVTVQAEKKTYTLAINLAEHRNTLLNDNTFLRYICQILADRISMLNDNMVAYSTSSAESRMATFILQNTSGNMLSCRLSDCSEALGISYRHVIRIINRFCEQNLMKKEKRHYMIIDENALTNLASDTYLYYD